MVVLDTGLFSSFDCGHRIGAVFLSTFLMQAAIVETSCIGPFPSEYRLDRAKLNFSFGHDPAWLTKRPLETAYLAITQTDKPWPIFIQLKGRPASRELQDLAPEAMNEYARYRASYWFR